MEHDNPNSLASRLIATLQSVENLDTVQAAFISNTIADMCPPLQRALLELIQTEKLRRDGVEIEGYPLPEFCDWPVKNALDAGTAIVVCSEVVAMAGEPSLQDFSWRMLQFYFIGLAKLLAEEAPL